jgi:hypothetical protein
MHETTLYSASIIHFLEQFMAWTFSRSNLSLSTPVASDVTISEFTDELQTKLATSGSFRKVTEKDGTTTFRFRPNFQIVEAKFALEQATSKRGNNLSMNLVGVNQVVNSIHLPLMIIIGALFLFGPAGSGIIPFMFYITWAMLTNRSPEHSLNNAMTAAASEFDVSDGSSAISTGDQQPQSTTNAGTVSRKNAAATTPVERKSRKGIFALATIAAIYFGMYYLNADQLRQEAGSLLRQHVENFDDKYEITDVSVPLESVISSNYQISVIMKNKAGGTNIVRPTVDGNCIFGSCAISIRGFEAMAL